jgi:hypothetical protein
MSLEFLSLDAEKSFRLEYKDTENINEKRRREHIALSFST